MQEERFISVVIPNRNGAATIGKCLAAAMASDYRRFELVVVDDCSEDESVEIIRGFPCRLVQLPKHMGVSKARNQGALASRGELLFFTDNDCLLEKDTLSLVNSKYSDYEGSVLGGTYTPVPHDRDFFSFFQSVFINHFETKLKEPDYVAAHAMAIDARAFRRSGGFIEDYFVGFAASVEDVEFSHRLRKAGYRLIMEPEIQVQHIFNFSLRRSLGNAVKKSRYWTMYSLSNKDLLRDSGAASVELKANVFLFFLQFAILMGALGLEAGWLLALGGPLALFNLCLNRRLIRAWFGTGGVGFGALATLYYTTLYALAVGVGALVGVLGYLWSVKLLRRYRSCTQGLPT